MACFQEPLPLGGVVAIVGALGVREQREYGQVLSLQSEFIIFFFFFFLAVLCGLQNLNSPTRDQTLARLPGKSLSASPLSVLCVSGVSLIVSCSCSKVFCGSLLPLESESNWMICLSKNPLLSKGLRSWNTVELFNALSCFL